MAVVAPPPTIDTDKSTLDERVAELEALIEEARRRTRKRRRRNGTVALAAMAAAGAALYAGGDGIRVGSARSADGNATLAPALDLGGSWSAPTGPPGFPAGVVLAPSRPDALYFAVFSSGRVFRSTNGGRSWSSGRPVASRIDVLTVDPRDDSILYAGTSDGVLKSADAGRTWRRLGFAPPAARREHARVEGYVRVIELDPTDSRVFYVGTEAGLYRSPDGGATWLRLRRAPRSSTIAIHPAAPTTLFAAVALPWTETDDRARSAIMRSTDSGRTWRTVARRDGYLSSLAVDPARPGTIWAAGSDGVLVTRDGGTTWLEAGRPPARNLDGVIVDSARADTLYVSAWQGRLFRSTDGGRSWQPFGAGHGLDELVIDPRAPGTMYAGDGYGVVKTTDGGATWRRSDAGIVASSLNAVAPAASNAATIYAGGSFGLSRSDDRGRTWAGLRTDGVASLAVDPRDDRHVLVGARGIVASRNGGDDWATAWLPSGDVFDEVRAIAFDAQDPLVAYAGTTLSGLIRSSDGGKNWRPVGGGPQPMLSLAVHPDRTGVVYAGLAGGVFASSTDGGVSWRNRRISGTTVNVQSLAVAPSDAQTIYAATNAGLARSVDGGDTWRLLPVRGLDCLAVVVDPQRAETVYVGTDRGGVLRSTNGGASWRPFGTRLPSRSISVLAFDATGTWLYAGTNGSGLTSIRIR